MGLSPDFRLNRPVVLLCVLSVKVGLEHLFFQQVVFLVTSLRHMQSPTFDICQSNAQCGTEV